MVYCLLPPLNFFLAESQKIISVFSELSLKLPYGQKTYEKCFLTKFINKNFPKSSRIDRKRLGNKRFSDKSKNKFCYSEYSQDSQSQFLLYCMSILGFLSYFEN